MNLSDKVISLLKEDDFSFEELKEKTNANFFELRDSLKELLKKEKIFKTGFPSKYSTIKDSAHIKRKSLIIEKTFSSISDYKEIFLTILIVLLLTLIYSIFFKSPVLYPGLEQRIFPVLLFTTIITILLYAPWKKLVGPLSNFLTKETILFLEEFKNLKNSSELKQYTKEFLEKIILPYYPHILIILSVISLFEIDFFSSFNQFFSPIALHLILISMGLIILKQKTIFKEKELCKYSFLLLLILVTLSSLSFEQITFLSEPLKAIGFQLTIFTIILGAITFYQNKEVIEEIEEEQAKEEKEEEKRALEFGKKYPVLARVPFLNYLLKSMCKEGWIYSILLGIILIFGLILYLNGISSHGFFGDEYYVVKVTQTFFTKNILFSLDGTVEYTRSILTSLVAIISKSFFDTLDPNSSLEFKLRFPFILFSLGSAFLVYLISKRYVSKSIALISTIIFITEVWFIYFAQLVRFYSISLFFIFLILYIYACDKNNLKKLIILLIFSLILSYFLSSYFLLITLFFGIILFLNFLKTKEKKYLILFGGVSLILSSIYFILLFSGVKYNNASFVFNLNALLFTLNWLFTNYPHIVILSLLASLFIVLNKKDRFVGLFGLISVLFAFGYINNVPFTFTFRHWYFIIPFLIISFLTGFQLIFKKNKLITNLYFLFLILISLSSYTSYPASNTGDYFYPSKLLYEKQELLFGNKDIAEFLDEYIQQNNLGDYQIYSIGLGGIDMYSDKNYIEYSYNSKNCDSVGLIKFKTNIESNSTNFIILHGTAITKRNNYIYSSIYLSNPLECSGLFENYINQTYNLIYNSNDGLSKVYLYSKN